MANKKLATVIIAVISASMTVSLTLISLGVFLHTTSIDHLLHCTLRNFEFFSFGMSAILELSSEFVHNAMIGIYAIMAFFIYQLIYQSLKKCFI